MIFVFEGYLELIVLILVCNFNQSDPYLVPIFQKGWSIIAYWHCIKDLLELMEWNKRTLQV